jgi:hypothetical protein
VAALIMPRLFAGRLGVFIAVKGSAPFRFELRCRARDQDRAIRNVCRLYGVNRLDAQSGRVRSPCSTTRARSLISRGRFSLEPGSERHGRGRRRSKNTVGRHGENPGRGELYRLKSLVAADRRIVTRRNIVNVVDSNS